MKVIRKQSVQDASFSLGNRLARVVWSITNSLLIRYSPVSCFAYRRKILNLLGAKLKTGASVYPSVKIWYPPNLVMEEGASIGPEVKIYNQGLITIGRNAIVSQGAHLCASTHDYNDPIHPLVLAPIIIGANAWICAEAFVGPGVTIGEGAVIGARAVVSKDAECWSVYAGNPATKVKERNRFE